MTIPGKVFTILVVACASSFVFLTFEYLGLPNATYNVIPAKSCERSPGYLLLTLSDRGLNESVNRGEPIIRLQRGDMVNILVCNLDSVQSHGFAIDHYFPVGVTLRPGEAYTISFVARDSGSFAVYCNVFCTVHIFMKGRLTVD